MMFSVAKVTQLDKALATKENKGVISYSQTGRTELLNLNNKVGPWSKKQGRLLCQKINQLPLATTVRIVGDDYLEGAY